MAVNPRVHAPRFLLHVRIPASDMYGEPSPRSLEHFRHIAGPLLDDDGQSRTQVLPKLRRLGPAVHVQRRTKEQADVAGRENMANLRLRNSHDTGAFRIQVRRSGQGSHRVQIGRQQQGVHVWSGLLGRPQERQDQILKPLRP
jgi:hypothetical protein